MVEPEHRLVARGLETEWEARLRDLSTAEAELTRREHEQPRALSPEQRQHIHALGSDLRQVWAAPTTTDRDCKELLPYAPRGSHRSRYREPNTARSSRSVGEAGRSPRSISRYRVRIPEVFGRTKTTIALLPRLAAHYSDEVIAGILNKQGRQTATGERFTANQVGSLRRYRNIPRFQPPADPPAGDLVTIRQAARILGVVPSTIHRWLDDGFIAGEQLTAGAPWRIRLTDDVRARFVEEAPPDYLPMLEATMRLGVSRQTADQGKTVPYIVRVETGYQDRDQYRIAILYDPEKQFTAWSPQDGWNHKVLINHGASCGIERQAGSAPDVMNDGALSRGFAVMSTALNNAGHNCSIVTQAESLVMAKERIVEQHGEIRYTIGTGCSGGSLTQQQVANAYPGIYQGILPACSFPDAWSTGQQLMDYNLVRGYVESPTEWAPGVAWTPADIAAVEGHPNHVNSIVFDTVYWTSLGVPDDGCPGVPADQVYNAQTNPGGVRCTLADYMINVFGPRPASDWGPVEQQLGRGFAGIPLDNVGVQYGLDALKKGLITTAQFVDLNAKIGGLDIDITPTPERIKATEPALQRAYKSGAVNSGKHLDKVAIIDLRGPDPGAFHDAYRSWAIRARIEREHGTFANHVIWFGAVPLMGDPGYADEALVAMDRWLAAVESDNGPGTLAEKIRRDRPERRERSLHAGPGHRDGHGCRGGLRAEGRADEVRHSAHGRRRGDRDRQQQVHAQAAAAIGLLPDRVHGQPVAAAPGGFPVRSLRLGRPGRGPAGRHHVADVPGRGRQRHLRRQASGTGAATLGRGLDERRVRLVARLAH